MLLLSNGRMDAAQQFCASIPLTPSLAPPQVSPLVEPMSLLRGGQPSPAGLVSRGKDALLGLKGYPTGSAGEAEVVQRLLGATTSRVQEAGHLLLERLIKGKVGDAEEAYSSEDKIFRWHVGTRHPLREKPLGVYWEALGLSTMRWLTKKICMCVTPLSICWACLLLQDKGSGPREVVVSWISMLLQVNEERTRLGEGGKALNPVHLACGKAQTNLGMSQDSNKLININRSLFFCLDSKAVSKATRLIILNRNTFLKSVPLYHPTSSGSSDGLLVNLVAVLLRFCRPFMVGYLEGVIAQKGGTAGGGKFGDLFVRHLDPGYYGSHRERLGDLRGANRLGGEQQVFPQAKALNEDC